MPQVIDAESFRTRFCEPGSTRKLFGQQGYTTIDGRSRPSARWSSAGITVVVLGTLAIVGAILVLAPHSFGSHRIAPLRRSQQLSKSDPFGDDVRERMELQWNKLGNNMVDSEAASTTRFVVVPSGDPYAPGGALARKTLRSVDSSDQSLMASHHTDSQMERPPMSTTKETPQTSIYHPFAEVPPSTADRSVVREGEAMVENDLGSNVKLFCFAVMKPNTYEVPLLQELLRRGLSLFACEEYTVFSDGELELSPGLRDPITTVDVGNVTCPYGGKWYLALNTEVFVKIWRRVISDATYIDCDWTIKVDPDSVFLAHRLRIEVAEAMPVAPVYLNNCDQGLHGPVEVVSRGGMSLFVKGIGLCEKKLRHEWDEWGEDVFLRHCLKLLGVEQVDNFNILAEDRCFAYDPTKQGCTSERVAYHPFKDVKSWFKCFHEATGHIDI